MIRVRRTAPPDVLTRPGGPGEDENKRARDHYSDPAKRATSFKFNMYKHADVTKALNELFHYKCAYCESSFEATAPVAVEHFRPKLAVHREDGEVIRPGYYWLAADWDNLLPSCTDCNSARYQEIAGLADPELTGKANLFPIENDARVSLNPGSEIGEKRLLAHPCRDQVEKFFAYQPNITGVMMSPAGGISSTSSRKADRSIKTYGLNRLGLVRKRGDKGLRLSSQIELVDARIQLLTPNPGSEDQQHKLALAICELQALEADSAEYAGFSRARNRSHWDAFNQTLSALMGNLLDAFPGSTPIERLMAKFPCPPRVFDPGN